VNRFDGEAGGLDPPADARNRGLDVVSWEEDVHALLGRKAPDEVVAAGERERLEAAAVGEAPDPGRKLVRRGNLNVRQPLPAGRVVPAGEQLGERMLAPNHHLMAHGEHVEADGVGVPASFARREDPHLAERARILEKGEPQIGNPVHGNGERSPRGNSAGNDHSRAAS
jgi:hypothetical protein